MFKAGVCARSLSISLNTQRTGTLLGDSQLELVSGGIVSGVSAVETPRRVDCLRRNPVIGRRNAAASLPTNHSGTLGVLVASSSLLVDVF